MYNERNFFFYFQALNNPRQVGMPFELINQLISRSLVVIRR